ncbi:TPA: UmoD [Morganella morganii]|nr:UmoD family flagellar biogenesis regulator [Morganella morganii]ELA9086657.1 UmoD [Morganella morganii]MCU6376037.1 UmoD [Morganella morganii]HEI9843127.1 UmoD [Morganella morganii]
MNKIERKPLSRITVTGLILLFVIFVIIISFAVTKNKHPAVAEVLSSEPIMATVPVRHEYCDLTAMPGPYKRDLLDIVHPTEQVCTPYLLYETLLHAPKVYGGPTYRACTMAYTYEHRIVGYDVVYKIKDTVGRVRINYNPGDVMPVDNTGRLIILPELNNVK